MMLSTYILSGMDCSSAGVLGGSGNRGLHMCVYIYGCLFSRVSLSVYLVMYMYFLVSCFSNDVFCLSLGVISPFEYVQIRYLVQIRLVLIK